MAIRVIAFDGGVRDLAVAWFIDGSYIRKIWSNAFYDYNSHSAAKNLDWLKLRVYIEQQFSDRIEDAYYFDADPDPPTAQRNAFHNWLSFMPPAGPGLRVKLYWLQHKELFWPRSMGGDPVIHPVTGARYRQTQQKAVDVGLAFHLMRSYSKRRWSNLALCAGDGDFHEVVQNLVENDDVTLALIGSNQSISSELRPYARKGVWDIIDLSDELKREEAPAPEMRAQFDE